MGGPLAGALTIQGPAQGVAIVAAPSIGDRVFDILPTGQRAGDADQPDHPGRPDAGDRLRDRRERRPVLPERRRHCGGALTLNNIWVRGNTARAGGGICHQGQGLTINNSILTGNATQGGDGGGLYSGGGIFHALGSGGMTIVSSRIAGNLARRIVGSDEAHGGGIASRADLTLTQSTFQACASKPALSRPTQPAPPAPA